MKISVDDKELFVLSDTQKKVLMDEISEDIFEEDIKRRLKWILIHKYEECFRKLKQEWEPKLRARGIKMFPSDADEFAQLIFSQPDYQTRLVREAIQVKLP